MMMTIVVHIIDLHILHFVPFVVICVCVKFSDKPLYPNNPQMAPYCRSVAVYVFLY